MKRSFFLMVVLFCFFLCSCSTAAIEDTVDVQIGNAGNSKQSEAEKCVRTYFEALSEGDEKKAELCFQEKDPERGIRIRVGKACGIQEYENLQMDAYPLDENQDEWLILVFYELAVDNFESRLPGMQTLLAYCDNDCWYLNEGTVEEESKKQMIFTILEGDEVIDKMIACNQSFQDVLLEEEGLREWADEVQIEITRAVAGELLEAESDVNPESTEETANAENEDKVNQENANSAFIPASRNSYEVKTGDCLWHIAMEQLGDGMLWKELYKWNQAIIGDDPNLILPGIFLELSEE